MKYQKQNFSDDLTLHGYHLNHIEDGLAEVAEKVEQMDSDLAGVMEKVEQMGDNPGKGSAVGIPGAVGDGATDDTDALTAALSQSNSVVDGGGKKYKYLTITLTGVENLTVRNVIFWKGQRIDLCGCKNIRFESCRFEEINCNDDPTAYTYGIRPMERKGENDEDIWCENIFIERCVFKNIWYNPSINGAYPNQVTGQAIYPRCVHNLFVKNCWFEQIKGNAAIHWNTPRKCGYAEITDNTFYLTAYGGVCIYAVDQVYPRVKGRMCNNRFVGCGLGYLPPEYLAAQAENMRGVGCAGLLGGVGDKTPLKWQFTCENNVFEDCVESSIEGPAWNPVIGNYMTGQGALQDEENCRAMEEKYHLDYQLQVRYNSSVNFIYRNYYRNTDGTYPNEDTDPIVFQGNTMGGAYVDRSSYILLRGDYNCPVIFNNNVMDIEDDGLLYTHILSAHFRKGFHFEGNHGIYPYLNQSTFEGNVLLDEMDSAWGCNFDKANVTLVQSKARFPELIAPLYDPSRMVLENDQATIENGCPVLRSYDIPETVEKPTDTAYDITSESAYTAENGYVFGGPAAVNRIDTGIQLFKDNGDFTVFLQFDGNGTTEISGSDGGIMPLITVYDKTTDSYRLTLGGRWGNNNLHIKVNKTAVSVKQTPLVLKPMQLLLRKKGNTIQCWAMYRGMSASDLTTDLVEVAITDADDLAGFEGTLYIGTPEGYSGEDSEKYALWGKMKAFQLFQRALSDNEVSLLLYNKLFASSDTTENPVPVYDLSTDEHYDSDAGAVTFDGSFGIDTGVKLFADSSDWTVVAKFRLDNYHDAGLPNFSFIPVLSTMNYAAENYKATSPGFDIGLSLQDGDDPEKIPTGGFLTFRNSWKFSNWAYILNSYFGYDTEMGVILIRKSGVLSVYDFNMQRLATLTGADATSIFDGTLHIGENMVAPPLAGNNKLKGIVYDCRVYDKALTTATLEKMFPNIYSNEVRTKGAVTCYVPNLQYKTQLIRYLFLEAVIDMGKYSAPEYAGKYTKAVGIKIDGVNEIIWCPTGSNTHIKRVFYAPKYIGPYGSISAQIVNTGLAPGLEATVKGFRCSLLTEEQAVTDASDALDFSVEWDKDSLEIAVGETLTGHVTYLPEDANTGTELELTITGTAATAEFAGDIITVTGAEAGEATVEAALPSGAKKAFTVTVTAKE